MHVVYWIHLKTEIDYNTQGYIGVTNNPKKRLAAHKQGYGNSNVKYQYQHNEEDIVYEILYESNEEECYNFEKKIRPTPLIGWNKAEGGHKPPSPKGNTARAIKASKALKGRVITWGDKISTARKGKRGPSESYIKMVQTRKERGYSVWNKGVKTGPQSRETIEKRNRSLQNKRKTKAVITPLGEFKSITDAAKFHNCSTQTLHARLKYYNMDGYRYV